MTEPSQFSASNVAVVGAGSWGTALALHLARRGFPVTLLTRDPEHAAAMAREGRNPKYLAEFRFPNTLEPSADRNTALSRASLVVVAVPSHGMRGTLATLRPALKKHEAGGPVLLLASKGIETDTLATMHEVAQATLPADYAASVALLGGPSFAAEVASGLPTTVVVAAEDPRVRLSVQKMLSGEGVRAYESDDVLGVELGGAFKNVIALAAGMCDGAGLGQNARAGLITRGLAEMTRLSLALGAHPATMAGLAGLGDLVLTCTGGLSRNRRVGFALGEGRRLDEILAELGMVAEGVNTTRAAHRLALRERVEMPIVETMHAILYEGLTVRDAVDALMGRKLKGERE